MVYEMRVNKCFHFLALGAKKLPWVYPGSKFIKRGDDYTHPDLPSCHRPPSIHAGDIRYKNLQTNTETVNDNVPACLSACGDNKFPLLSSVVNYRDNIEQ